MSTLIRLIKVETMKRTQECKTIISCKRLKWTIQKYIFNKLLTSANEFSNKNVKMGEKNYEEAAQNETCFLDGKIEQLKACMKLLF